MGPRYYYEISEGTPDDSKGVYIYDRHTRNGGSGNHTAKCYDLLTAEKIVNALNAK